MIQVGGLQLGTALDLDDSHTMIEQDLQDTRVNLLSIMR